MLDMLKRHEIQVLRKAGHSLPKVAELAGVSVEASSGSRTKRRSQASIAKRSGPGGRSAGRLHDEDLAQAIVNRILERGRILTLDGPSIRTNHLGLDEGVEGTSNQGEDNLARISGIGRPEFPEPTIYNRQKDLRRGVNVVPHAFHGEWNYSIRPRRAYSV